MPKPSDCQSASETAWQLARQREAVIRPLAEDPWTRHADVDAAAGRLGLCRSYVYRLLARYRCRPQTSSLLSAQQRGRPEGTRLVDEQREALIKSAIQDFYLQQERPRMTDLMRDIQQRCHQLNIKPPHRRTVHKRVLEIDAKRRTQLRLGSKSANAQFRPVRSSPFQDLRLSLQNIQIYL